MNRNNSPLVSIIIPTYNEELDIEKVLRSLVGLTYRRKEILVVDDKSLDKTVKIAKRFAKKYPAITVIQKDKNEGPALARNVGIYQAKGEIIIILNADVVLPHDFIERILLRYNRGADYLLVEAEALEEKEKLFPRWTNAFHHFRYDDTNWINWTEGFSCRRKAAIDVGLFPFVGVNPAGEDAVFGNALENAGYKKVIDKTIVVHHYVPSTLREFWAQRRGRGKGTVFMWFYISKYSKLGIFLRLLLHTLYNLAYVLLIFPAFIESIRVVKYSPFGLRDFVSFALVNMYDSLARLRGKWMAFFKILKS